MKRQILLKNFFVLKLLIFLVYACQQRETTQATQENQTTQARSETNKPESTASLSKRLIEVSDISAPNSYEVEAFVTNLSYPVDITFSNKGETFIAEAGGHTYGTKPAKAPNARILKLMPDGSKKVIYENIVPVDSIRKYSSSENMPEGIIPPLTGITWHNEKIYVSHRSRYSVLDPSTGEFKTIINGLPSWGEFLNAKPKFGPDGKMYFFLSTQGNTGVIEAHWVKVLDVFNKYYAHEIPGEDVVLTGQNYKVPLKNLYDKDSAKETKLTGVYVPLGTVTEPGQVIKGQKICNGAFFRVNTDGSNLERICWGLRSSFGYDFSPDGKLYATMNSANPMPPRGLLLDYEPVYEIKDGEWYGWPDFYSGIPITDERFEVKDQVRKFALTEETHKKLLKGKKEPVQPLARLTVHSAAEGMVYGKNEFGIPENNILVAEMGTIIPMFKDSVWPPEKRMVKKNWAQGKPEGVKMPYPGFKVEMVNIKTGETKPFIANKTGKPASATNGGGLERPIQLAWGPDGSLYVVDFGRIDFTEKGMTSYANTGVIWKVKYNENIRSRK